MRHAHPTTRLTKPIEVSASILSADFSLLGETVRELALAGADRLHLDVMDGHFVPNLTFGPQMVAGLRAHSQLPFEAHLMVTNPDDLIPQFAEAGADIIIVHPEASPHVHRSLMLIKSLGKRAGIALNPATSISCIDYCSDVIDQVLIMTVNPGFAGQRFLEPQLVKIQLLREKLEQRGWDIEIAVDGGITSETAHRVVEAGANVLVAGTSVFQGGHKDWPHNIRSLRGVDRRG